MYIRVLVVVMVDLLSVGAAVMAGQKVVKEVIISLVTAPWWQAMPGAQEVME